MAQSLSAQQRENSILRLVAASSLTLAAAVTAAYSYAALQKKRATGGAAAAAVNVYDTQQSLFEYLLMHFGTADELLHTSVLQSTSNNQDRTLIEAIDYPKHCAQVCIDLAHSQSVNSSAQHHITKAAADWRILEIGCAVGRTAFELSTTFNSITALDYSHQFIDAANVIKQQGSYSYSIRTEGQLVKAATASIDTTVVNSNNITFVQGDACNLNTPSLLADGPKFNILLACNLLCRLPQPRRFLNSLNLSLLSANAYVILMSPYTWLTQFTEVSEWIGGYVDASTQQQVTCAEALAQEMTGRGFVLITESDMPFFIRETNRKSQWTVAHKTVWQLRA